MARPGAIGELDPTARSPWRFRDPHPGQPHPLPRRHPHGCGGSVRHPTATRMRVGMVVPGFSANADDWCIPALRHLARALATHDDLRVIAVRYPYRASRYNVEGADVIAVGGAERRGAATLGVWGRTLNVLRSEHRRRAFDVLHGFWATESG